MTLTKSEANALSRYIGLLSTLTPYLPPQQRQQLIDLVDELTNLVSAARWSE